jgi:hypothetical protein
MQLGRGGVELEVFLEPTCPFSKIAFGKLQPLLDAVGEGELTIRIRFLSQPWHLFSGIVTRSILAASATAGGKQAGFSAMRAHLCGFDLSDAFRLTSVDQALRWHTKYCRQNGVHVSPTFAVNRLINTAMSSGQSIEEWAKQLDLPIRR